MILACNHIEHAFAEEPILSDATFHINEKERAALPYPFRYDHGAAAPRRSVDGSLDSLSLQQCAVGQGSVVQYAEALPLTASHFLLRLAEPLINRRTVRPASSGCPGIPSGRRRFATPPTALRLWAPPSYGAEGGYSLRR